jgi:hypothetical protein
MSVQVGSQAYLGSDAFHRKYMRLLNEFGAVVVLMTKLQQGETHTAAIAEIQEYRKRLSEAWPLANESAGPTTGQAVDELISWMDAIIARATDLISSHLTSLLR